MARVLIPDGYTRKTKTEPTEFRYPVVEIQYRPALPAAHSEYRHACAGGAKAEEKAAIALLTAHIIAWDVTGEKDEPLPVTAENLARVPQPIRGQLVDIVCGFTPQEQEAAAKNSSSASG